MFPVVDPDPERQPVPGTEPLLDVTRRVHAANALPPAPVADLRRRARHLRARRRGGTVVAAAAFTAVLGAAIVARPGPGGQVMSGGGSGGTPPVPTAPRNPAAPVLPHDQSDVIVFLQPNGSQQEIKDVKAAIEIVPGVVRNSFVNQQQAYEEFRELFSDSPEMLESVSPDAVPPSFRIDTRDDTVAANRIKGLVGSMPGVREVVLRDQHGNG